MTDLPTFSPPVPPTKNGTSRWSRSRWLFLGPSGISESPVSVVRTRWVTPARRMIVRCAALFAIGIGGAEASESLDFNQDIRPILSNACFKCHGPDSESRKADLRLYQRESAVDDAEVIVPGNPEKSELIARVSTDDPDDRMPPPDHGGKLTDAQIKTLEQWIREGRTANNAMLGRDHYPDCFSMFMCGGGSKPGPYGETDDLGFGVVKDKVHVHDLQATILHLLGFDHEKLTYRFQGRDYRLTDVHGKPVRGVIA